MTQRRIPARDSRDALVHKMAWVPQFAHDALRAVMHESLNRDEERTPMQWAPGTGVGFCPPDATPWLPPPDDTKGRTVAEQEGRPDSLLSCYRRFLAARKAHPALSRGSLVLLPVGTTPREVAAWTRTADGQTLTVLLNASPCAAHVHNPVPGGRVVVSTDFARTSADGATLELGPWEGIVLAAGDAGPTA